METHQLKLLLKRIESRRRKWYFNTQRKRRDWIGIAWKEGKGMQTEEFGRRNVSILGVKIPLT